MSGSQGTASFTLLPFYLMSYVRQGYPLFSFSILKGNLHKHFQKLCRFYLLPGLRVLSLQIQAHAKL